MIGISWWDQVIKRLWLPFLGQCLSLSTHTRETKQAVLLWEALWKGPQFISLEGTEWSVLITTSEAGSGSFNSSQVLKWLLLYPVPWLDCNFRKCYESGFPGGSVVKCRRLRRGEFNSWVGKIPWRRKWQPTPVFCLENPIDRSLAGYTPWGSQSQTWLGMHAQNHQLSWSCTPDQQELWKISICCFKLQFFEATYYVITRESNGTPVQYSCLENPMDGGAWWTAVYGVAQCQTRLKRLSSSSSSSYVITDRYNDYLWVVLNNIASEQGTHFLAKKVCQWAHAHWVYWFCQVKTPSEVAELIKEPSE